MGLLKRQKYLLFGKPKGIIGHVKRRLALHKASMNKAEVKEAGVRAFKQELNRLSTPNAMAMAGLMGYEADSASHVAQLAKNAAVLERQERARLLLKERAKRKIKGE